MGVRKLHAARGKRVHVRRGDLAVGIETLYIALAQVITKNKDDVWLVRPLEGESSGEKCERGKKAGSHE